MSTSSGYIRIHDRVLFVLESGGDEKQITKTTKELRAAVQKARTEFDTRQTSARRNSQRWASTDDDYRPDRPRPRSGSAVHDDLGSRSRSRTYDDLDSRSWAEKHDGYRQPRGGQRRRSSNYDDDVGYAGDGLR